MLAGTFRFILGSRGSGGGDGRADRQAQYW